jgi:hypothetical protein
VPAKEKGIDDDMLAPSESQKKMLFMMMKGQYLRLGELEEDDEGYLHRLVWEPDQLVYDENVPRTVGQWKQRLREEEERVNQFLKSYPPE